MAPRPPRTSRRSQRRQSGTDRAATVNVSPAVVFARGFGSPLTALESERERERDTRDLGVLMNLTTNRGLEMSRNPLTAFPRLLESPEFLFLKFL